MPPTVGQYLECKILDLKIEIITFYKPLHKSEFDVSNILCYCAMQWFEYKIFSVVM